MRQAITQELFNKIKTDIKIGIHKKDIAEYHHISYETVRKVSNTSSFNKWQKDKALTNQSRHIALRDVQLHYEEPSNWFMKRVNKLRGKTHG
jgi:hypothetical protein